MTRIENGGGGMEPDKVRFSQRSIRFQFRDGSTINDLAQALLGGRVLPVDVPPLRLMEKNGLLFTLDNRRLEAFRRAGVTVPWRMATEQEIAEEAWKFTTTNEGKSVRVRGEPS